MSALLEQGKRFREQGEAEGIQQRPMDKGPERV